MKLSEGIQVYTEARQSEGTPWTKGAKYLRSLSRQIGDIALARVRVNDVTAFLDGPRTSPVSWYKKYSVVRGFFRYWKARNEIYGLPFPCDSDRFRSLRDLARIPSNAPSESSGARFAVLSDQRWSADQNRHGEPDLSEGTQGGGHCPSRRGALPAADARSTAHLRSPPIDCMVQAWRRHESNDSGAFGLHGTTRPWLGGALSPADSGTVSEATRQTQPTTGQEEVAG